MLLSAAASILLLSGMSPCQTYSQFIADHDLTYPGYNWKSAYQLFLKDHPSCDMLHVPLLVDSPDDPDVYDEYFRYAAQDPAILASFLERHDEIYPFLPNQYQDSISLLERMLWARRLPKETSCPCGFSRGTVNIRGFMEEITDKCITLTLYFTIPPNTEEHVIVLTWEEMLNVPVIYPRVINMLDRAGVEKLYTIYYRSDQEIRTRIRKRKSVDRSDPGHLTEEK